MDKPNFLLDKTLAFRLIPIFNGLNFFERKLVFDAMEVLDVKQSQMVYKQGDPPDSFYCILSGRIQIFIEKEKREEVLEHLHRGKYFGFISILTGEVHSVSARAVTDAVLVKIAKRDFDIILKSIPRLAIDLSAMLSRRLKKRDATPKSIFESTIISVYADDSLSRDSALYAFNLALSLRYQTAKKVIVVDGGPDPSIIGEAIGADLTSGFAPEQLFFHAEDVEKKITRHSSGVDVLRVSFDPQKKPDAAFLVSLLTMLVNDYHYTIFHLTSSLGVDVFKVLAQSDLVHLLVSSDVSLLKQMSAGLQDSGIWTNTELKKKIKLIVLEEIDRHGKGPQLSIEEESSLFHQPIYATLPRPHGEKYFLVDDRFMDVYSNVLRRISRHVGEVLIGLALGSGSAMGMAHIGVLKVLEKEEIPVDIVAGSSIGAMIGALWCIGFSASEVEEIILRNKHNRYIFGLDDLALPLHGLIKGEHVHRFLKKYLKDKTFFDLKRKLKIVACDCMSMRQVVFDSGKLIDAVMASISIPGVFVPYKSAGRYYIDGGILNPLPTDILVEFGARKIISVNVLPSSDDIERTYELLTKQEEESALSCPFFLRPIYSFRRRLLKFFRPHIFDVIVSSVQSIEFLLAQMSSLNQSDVALHPNMTGVSWKDFENIRDLVKRGEEETRLHLTQIKDLVSST